MSEHTPSPWTYSGPYAVLDDQMLWVHTPNINKRGLRAVIAMVTPHPDEDMEANARLIAAAPDLLAACEKVIAKHKMNIESSVFHTVSAAIAKAKPPGD